MISAFMSSNRAPLPLFSSKQTFANAIGTSVEGQKQKSQRNVMAPSYAAETYQCEHSAWGWSPRLRKRRGCRVTNI